MPEIENPQDLQIDHRHADEGMHAYHGANVRNHFVLGVDRPFFAALAVAISIVSAFYSFDAGRQLSQYVYWMQREESFTEQLSSQGIHVPQDILDHIRKEHDK